MKKTLLSLCVLSAFLGACSSSSDESGTGSSSGGGLLGDPTTEPGAAVNAANYDTLLNAGMELLRADVYRQLTELLNQVATQWEPLRDSVIGSAQHACPGGGTVNRVISNAPDPAGQREFTVVSELQMTNCVAGDATLNGTAGWTWYENGSLSGTSYKYSYAFDKISIQLPEYSETLTGSYEEYIDLAGPGDGYTRTSSTQSYQRKQGTDTVSLTDSSYTQRYGHYIAQLTPANGIDHRFSESGGGRLGISALGLTDATISIDPELVYRNIETADSAIHTDALASGAIMLKLIGGSQLDVAVSSMENNTVTYTITDTNGQQSAIEREWISPAQCRADARFNYDSCK